MMAGLLFARAGIDTLVLEKHGDFLRDFRGDTVHPSTMEILHQLGMLERFLERPHNRIYEATGNVAGQKVRFGDLRHLKTPAPFIAMMPQWDFLDFLRDEAEQFPGFKLRMVAPAADVISENGRIAGITLQDGTQVRARHLTVFADGRSSLVRTLGLLPVHDLGSSIDVFWFKLPRKVQNSEGLQGVVAPGRLLALLGRGDYWQCAFVIPKGEAEWFSQRGIAAFRAEIEQLVPEIGSVDQTLKSIDDLHLLNVRLDRLERWSMPGLLAIGDAAHAMSPIGGIGINLAIQDAVAAANILAEPIRRGENIDALLHRVQKRRLFPTRVIQSGQRFAQERIIGGVLALRQPIARPPLPIRMLNRFPLLRRIPGRIIGLGVRRESVRSPVAP
jgi:2-polyprenyl-6-methoxyphenol hydroxylase-like FAD-dependent oxidoreductase